MKIGTKLTKLVHLLLFLSLGFFFFKSSKQFTKKINSLKKLSEENIDPNICVSKTIQEWQTLFQSISKGSVYLHLTGKNDSCFFGETKKAFLFAVLPLDFHVSEKPSKDNDYQIFSKGLIDDKLTVGYEKTSESKQFELWKRIE